MRLSQPVSRIPGTQRAGVPSSSADTWERPPAERGAIPQMDGTWEGVRCPERYARHCRVLHRRDAELDDRRAGPPPFATRAWHPCTTRPTDEPARHGWRLAHGIRAQPAN